MGTRCEKGAREKTLSVYLFFIYLADFASRFGISVRIRYWGREVLIMIMMIIEQLRITVIIITTIDLVTM